MNLGIMWTDGAIDGEASRESCYKEGWVPLLVVRPRDNPTAPPSVILFRNAFVAEKFIQKNQPKGWLPGIIDLTDEDLARMESNGWTFTWLDHERKIGDDHPTLIRGYEVHEFVTKPTYHTMADAALFHGPKTQTVIPLSVFRKKK